MNEGDTTPDIERCHNDESIAEAIEYLREWAREGFPKRVDHSFPTDFLTCMRRIMDLPVGAINSRTLEEALVAGPDFDHILPRHAQWSWDDTTRAKRALADAR